MKIKWLGHASFLITSAQGTRVVTDPYTPGGPLKYGKIQETADVVTVSHEHGDHSDVSSVKGNPQVFRGAGAHMVKGVEVKGISAFHDTSGGSERGTDTLFRITADGITVAHMGDLGHLLTAEQVEEMGNIDVLLLPVGGVSTINAAMAAEVIRQLEPKLVVPMHYKTPEFKRELDPVDKFFREMGIQPPPSPQPKLAVTRSNLPDRMQVVLLGY